jgi:hypothetical protein
MKIIDSPIPLRDLAPMAREGFGDLVKAVVDVERALNWISKGNPDYSRRALERGLELLELTIADPKHRHRLKELARLREVLLDYFLGENQFGSTESSWKSYFHAYGVAAAIKREATC